MARVRSVRSVHSVLAIVARRECVAAKRLPGQPRGGTLGLGASHVVIATRVAAQKG